MTKRDLMKWLDEQHIEARKNLSEKQKVEITLAKEAVYKEIGLSTLVESVQKLSTTLSETISNFVEDNSETVQAPNYYSSLLLRVRPYTCSTSEVMAELLDYTFNIDTKGLVSLRKRHDEELEKVSKNYQGVIAQAQGLKNAKEVVTYLENLDFDLEPLREKLAEPVVTALATPIDTSFLHISKEAPNG